MDSKEEIPVLGGYSIDELRRLYNEVDVIPEDTEETYKVYVDAVKRNYDNLQSLEEYLKEDAKSLEVSNYGNIKFKGELLTQSLVKNGPHKGFYRGWFDEYFEVNIPGIYIKDWVFLVHRLVAEAWRGNPNGDGPIEVHHIGKKPENNAKNLLIVTRQQHELIHG